MQMAQHFEDISIDDILSVAEREHEAHSRFVQVLCINGEEGIDLVYSYQKTADQGYAVHNYRVHGVNAGHAYSLGYEVLPCRVSL